MINYLTQTDTIFVQIAMYVAICSKVEGIGAILKPVVFRGGRPCSGLRGIRA
jgi:hypothetical protein